MFDHGRGLVFEMEHEPQAAHVCFDWLRTITSSTAPILQPVILFFGMSCPAFSVHDPLTLRTQRTYSANSCKFILVPTSYFHEETVVLPITTYLEGNGGGVLHSYVFGEGSPSLAQRIAVAPTHERTHTNRSLHKKDLAVCGPLVVRSHKI